MGFVNKVDHNKIIQTYENVRHQKRTGDILGLAQSTVGYVLRLHGIKQYHNKVGIEHRPSWTVNSWDDGHFKAVGDKHFFVFFPEISRSKNGYLPRSHAVWYKVYGMEIPSGWVLHHIDENPLNDLVYNLRLMTNSEHAIIHKTTPKIKKICPNCGKVFYVIKSKINQVGCSMDCRQNSWIKRRANVK